MTMPDALRFSPQSRFRLVQPRWARATARGVDSALKWRVMVLRTAGVSPAHEARETRTVQISMTRRATAARSLFGAQWRAPSEDLMTSGN